MHPPNATPAIQRVEENVKSCLDNIERRLTAKASLHSPPLRQGASAGETIIYYRDKHEIIPENEEADVRRRLDKAIDDANAEIDGALHYASQLASVAKFLTDAEPMPRDTPERLRDAAQMVRKAARAGLVNASDIGRSILETIYPAVRDLEHHKQTRIPRWKAVGSLALKQGVVNLTKALAEKERGTKRAELLQKSHEWQEKKDRELAAYRSRYKTSEVSA